MTRITFLLVAICTTLRILGQDIMVERPVKLDSNVNTTSEEVFPLLNSSRSRLYFVRAFHSENVGGALSGQDIWYAQKDSTGRWGKALNLSVLNSPLNNVVVGTGMDDSTLFLLNTYSGKIRWNFGISFSKKTNGEWIEPDELPVKFEYSGQFRGYYITPKADVILASSESKDSYGSEDLFLYRKKDDNWTKPFHFDQTINTAGVEISPFLSEDYNILFFASNGHEGFGDFDIYMSERLDDTWEKWSPPVNLGQTINSQKFEAYLATYGDGQTFFVSNKESKNTDIYATTLAIRLIGQETRKMLELSALLNSRFSEVLVMDTTISVNVLNVVSVTPEVPHNIGNVLKGNALMNQRLLGVDERDSLINRYVSEQGKLVSSSVEYTKLNLYNRALSEDINTMINRNADTEKKIADIPVDAGKLGASARQEHYLIRELKSAISKQIMENAALKQRISKSVGQNSFLKHSFTLRFVNEKGAILSQVASNNASIEEGVSQWIINLEAINKNVSRLIEVTSALRVYLSENTKELLSENTLNQKFEEKLAVDTAIGQRLAYLLAEIPGLSKNVEKLLKRDSLLNNRLFSAKEADFMMDQNVLALAGTDRTSREYQKLSSTTRTLSQNVAQNMSESAAKVDTSLIKPEENVLARDLPEQIAKNITLKQGISELIVENVKLKENLALATDGGDSTTALLTSRTALLKERLGEWETTIETLENSTSSLEKTYSPYQYATGILAKNAASNRRFKDALGMDTTISQDIARRISEVPELKSTLGELVATNSSSDYDLLGVGHLDASIDQNLAKISRLDSSSGELSKLISENAAMSKDLTESVDRNAAVTQDITQKVLNLQSQAPSVLLRSIEQNVSNLMLANASLRQGTAELVHENVTLKLNLTRSGNADTAVASRIASNTRLIEQKIDEWFANMEAVKQYAADLTDALARSQRSREILAQNNVLNKQIKELLSDQSIIRSAAKAAPAGELEIADTKLNRALRSINRQELSMNETLLKLMGSDSIVDRVDKLANNIVLADSIQKLADRNDTILSEMTKKVPDSSGINVSIPMVKNALVKQELAELIDRNASLKLYFDEEANSFDASAIGELEAGNLAVEQKINEWTASLKGMGSPATAAAGSQPPAEKSELTNVSVADPNVDVKEYTIQILAMGRGVQPPPSFFDKTNKEDVKMSQGKDGLDRYYIGRYNSLYEALEAAKAIRVQGYKDAFVRAMTKYGDL